MTQASTPHRRSLVRPIIGMSCAFIGVLALAHAGDYIFAMYPNLNDVWNSVKVEVSSTTRFFTTYGVWLWLVAAAGNLLSLGLAIIRPGRASTLVVNVTVCCSAVGLAWLVKESAISPLLDLLMNIGRSPR